MNNHHTLNNHRREVNNGLVSLADEAQAKESDLLKLLGRADSRANGVRSSNGSHNGRHQMNGSKSNLLSPLAHDMQLISDAAEADKIIKKRSLENFDGQRKKMNYDIPEEEGDEGLDFFETMRNLSAPYEPTRGHHERRSLNEHGRKRRGSGSRNGSFSGSRNDNQPVSQHHPLHYSQSSLTPAPESVPVEEEEEDLLDVYGLFYNSHPKESSVEAANQVATQPLTGLIELTNPFAFPFNPS